jgi:hypothetical protein
MFECSEQNAPLLKKYIRNRFELKKTSEYSDAMKSIGIHTRLLTWEDWKIGFPYLLFYTIHITFTAIHNFQDWYCHLYSSCGSMMQWKMTALAHLWNKCTTFHAAGGCADLLCPFIWSHVSGLRQFCIGSDSECTSLRKSQKSVWWRAWQWLDKCSGKKA